MCYNPASSTAPPGNSTAAGSSSTGDGGGGQSASSKGLTGGEIAGVVIASVIGVGIIGASAYYCCQTRGVTRGNPNKSILTSYDGGADTTNSRSVPTTETVTSRDRMAVGGGGGGGDPVSRQTVVVDTTPLIPPVAEPASHVAEERPY